MGHGAWVSVTCRPFPNLSDMFIDINSSFV